MPDLLNETLHGWQNFYFMTGGAAAALIGLMFVALSLAMNMVTTVNAASFKHFVTPSIIYFTAALVMACIMLAPAYSAAVLVVMAIISGIGGLMLTGSFARYLIQAARQYQDFDVLEWLAQVILPVASFGLILAGGILLIAEQIPLAFGAWWLAMIFLLLCGIRNTWSIVLWIIDQRKE